MKLTDMFLAELEREAAGTRGVLERVPEGRNDWKPHEKSMSLGSLASLVATMPSWAAMMVTQNELDLRVSGESNFHPRDFRTSRELVEMFEAAVSKAREALANTTDEHLMTSWTLRAGSNVLNEQPRHIAIRDGVFNHLAHHRGQLTVYLRLNDARVPSVYGPSVDEEVLTADTRG